MIFVYDMICVTDEVQENGKIIWRAWPEKLKGSQEFILTVIETQFDLPRGVLLNTAEHGAVMVMNDARTEDIRMIR